MMVKLLLLPKNTPKEVHLMCFLVVFDLRRAVNDASVMGHSYSSTVCNIYATSGCI